VTLTRFESVEAIRAFAGEDYEVPMLEPEALALLSRYEGRAAHFDTTPFRSRRPLVGRGQAQLELAYLHHVI
jgi:hypothetical protein